MFCLELTEIFSQAHCIYPFENKKKSPTEMNLIDFYCVHIHVGGAVAQSVERATPGQEVPGSIPAVAARSLLVGSVSV